MKNLVNYSTYGYTGKPTGTSKEQFEIVKELYEIVKTDYTKLDNKSKLLKSQLKKLGSSNFYE